MAELKTIVKRLLKNAVLFAQHASGLQLRSYQQQVACAVVDSILHRKGQTFVIIFPRQSGKNELQAQLETYLLILYSQLEAEMVKVSPTWKPQSLNAMRRLERVLERNLITKTIWTKRSGYIYQVGSAKITFLSGAPTSNVVGATASLLLQCDEAQDVSTAKWDKEINPMAAATNATKIFWGTAWTSQTLLAREKKTALEKEKKDGIRRVFQIDADMVGQEVPAYKSFVEEEIFKLGRSHPFVKTQYFSEEIDAEGGMFPPERLVLMQGSHTQQRKPLAGCLYAFLVDVAGEEEDMPDLTEELPERSQSRDSTALTIVQIDLASLDDETKKAPTYKVVQRFLWTGVKHTSLFTDIQSLADGWEPRRIIVDATGIGAGMASFLSKAFPGIVQQFIFSRKSKSDLGWDFIAVIETGRYQEYKTADELQEEFWLQCKNTVMEIVPGPERRMKWGVPDRSRDPVTGEPVHDDLVVSAALCALLDGELWGAALSEVIPSRDPLLELDF